MLFLFLAGRTSLAQEQKDWDWVNKHFFNVLDELMPLEERPGLSLGYRSYRDLHTDEPEYSFVFNRILQERQITVTVRQPQSSSIYDQLMALHLKNANQSIERIKKQLKVKEQHFSERACPAVRAQYEQFYRLTLEMLTDKERAEQARGEITLTLHPRVHTFKADIFGGRFQLDLTEQEHPFVIWARSTREALERCNSNVTKPSRRDERR